MIDAQLRAYLAAAGRRRFAYGRHDCLTVAARWVREATGRDVLEGHRYSSLRDGLERLAAHGLADQVEVFGRALPRRPRLLLRAGDIAVLPGRRLPALGIVMSGGERVWCFGPGGAGSAALTQADHGFGVFP